MTASQGLMQFAKSIQESVNTCLPARVVQVNEDGTVNVVAIRNDEIEDCVITVPVIRPETQRAYIQLKINVGDRGIVKFCDKSIEDYRLTGTEYYNGDDRVHSISDGVFQLGFLPNNEKFLYPEGEIVIGLKNQTFVLSVDEKGNLTMSTQNITLKATEITIDSPKTTIGTGGQPIARVGDSVQVEVTSGSSAGTWNGTITSGGVNTSI